MSKQGKALGMNDDLLISTIDSRIPVAKAGIGSIRAVSKRAVKGKAMDDTVLDEAHQNDGVPGHASRPGHETDH